MILYLVLYPQLLKSKLWARYFFFISSIPRLFYIWHLLKAGRYLNCPFKTDWFKITVQLFSFIFLFFRRQHVTSYCTMSYGPTLHTSGLRATGHLQLTLATSFVSSPWVLNVLLIYCRRHLYVWWYRPEHPSVFTRWGNHRRGQHGVLCDWWGHYSNNASEGVGVSDWEWWTKTGFWLFAFDRSIWEEHHCHWKISHCICCKCVLLN